MKNIIKALNYQTRRDYSSKNLRNLPEFEEADRNHDEAAACLAWYYFAMEFHDGHVMINPYSERVRKEVLERACGNDYGLSLMTLSDGKTVSVNVEKDSIGSREGIHNGREQIVTLNKTGSYAGRWEETIEILNRGVEISNLEWKNINDKTALLRMRFMDYDAKQNFDLMEEEVRNKLLELKEAGVTNLIFDLRSNAGGSASHVERIAKLIAPEGEHTYIYDGVLNMETMKYEKGDLHIPTVPGRE